MNYAGKFDVNLPADDAGSHPNANLHAHSVSTHAPPDAIIVPEANLLFNGDFKRSGVDLILSKDDHELVLRDYFKGEHRAPLASPDGAHLTGDIISALTGYVQYSQADGTDAVAHVAIGHVTKLTGSVTAMRNGVSVILNNGDNVEKGDVVATGSDSSVGITFIDGTVFGLSHNARMVLNEMVYDPNGSNNSSLMSLVAGTISFVAGETAKHGDMKVDTPVATMGIRGTAVLVEIDFDVPAQGGAGAPDAKFQVLVEPDGSTGSYILFDKQTLAPIAEVNQAGTQTIINGQGVVSFLATAPLSLDAQKVITDVFSLKFSDLFNSNTKTTTAETDSIVPVSFGVKLANGDTVTPTILLVNTPLNQINSLAALPTSGNERNPNPPSVSTTNGAFSELPGVTNSSMSDTVSGTISFGDPNLSDRPTATATFASATFQNAEGKVIPPTALTALQLADIAKVEAGLTLVANPGNTNDGSDTWTYTVPDKELDFLAAGETLTLTYNVDVVPNFAQANAPGTGTITVTITGANDAPMITAVVPPINFSGGTNVAGGPLTTTSNTSGMFKFTDADLDDTHTVTAALALNEVTLNGKTVSLQTLAPGLIPMFDSALTASLATDSTGSGTGTVNWSLAPLPAYVADIVPKGETLTLTYVVTVTDDNGAIATEDITVNITGTAHAAVVWIATTTPGSTAGGFWNVASNWETGNVPTSADDVIIVTDQLQNMTPSLPVTIDAPAFAKNLTLNDFNVGTLPPTELINQSTLTVGGALDVLADSIVNNSSSGTINVTGNVKLNDDGASLPPQLINSGTLTVGGALDLLGDSIVNNSGIIGVTGAMEILGTSQFTNSGTITLAGGDFKTSTTVMNTGTIEVSGGTLNVQVDIANSVAAGGVTTNGTLLIDLGAALNLKGATISGGTVTDNGTLDLSGTAVIDPGVLGNTGQINVRGAGNALDGETIANSGTIEVLAGGVLLIDQGSTVANTGKITVDAAGSELRAGTLTLNGATVTGGTITDKGTIDVTGSSEIEGVTTPGTTPTTVNAILNGGAVTVESGALLTLDDVTATGTTFTGISATSIIIQVDDTVVLDGVTINDGTVQNAGTVQIDDGKKLTLNGAIVNGGIINDGTVGGTGGLFGRIDVTGSSAIENASLNNGRVTVENATLTLDNDTVSGTTFTGTASGGIIQVDGGTTLTLSGVTITGGTINDTSPSGTGGTIDITGASKIDGGATLNSGAVTVESATLTLDNVTVDGTTITEETTGSLIKVGDGDTLTLEGGATIQGRSGIDTTSTVKGAISNAGTIDVESVSGASLDGVTVTDNALADGIEVGMTTASGAVLTLDGGTSITGGTLTLGASASFSGTLEIETGVLGSGATLNDVNVANTWDAIDISETTSGAILTLDGGTKVTGGTMTIGYNTGTGGAGALDIESGGATLDGVSVTNTYGTINVDGAMLVQPATLTLDDGTTVTGGGSGMLTINAGDTLDVEAGTNGLNHGATLDGVLVTDNGALDVGDVNSGAILTLDDGTTVTGGGSGTLTINAGNTLDILDGSNTLGATLDGVLVGDYGAIQIGSSAVSEDPTLTLDDGTTVTGAGTGMLIINAGDTLDVEAGTNGLNHGATLDGVLVTDSGALDVGEVNSGAILTLDDGTTITGHGTGTLTINAGDTLDILDGSNTLGATLDGVLVGDYGAIQIGSPAVSGDPTLTLDDGTTITGQGTGTLTINAGNTLEVETGANGPSYGATLDGVLVTDSGAIEIGATTSGAILTLDDGTSITGGGTLTIGSASGSGSGELDIAAGPGATLDGVGITNYDTIHIDDGATLTIADTVTLQGGGMVVLMSTGDSTEIVGSATDSGNPAELDNVDNTISGVGTIGTGDTLALQNDASGIIDANVSGQTLSIDVSTSTNSGLIEAHGGILTLTENQPGSTNSGTIEAIDGGTLTITHLLTDNGGVFTAATATNELGGLIEADGSGSTLTINTLPGDANFGTEEAVNGGKFDLIVGSNPNAVSGGGNYGTMEAMSGGTFSISGGSLNEPGSMGQTEGLIEATGQNSQVDFSDGTVVNGGLIEALGGGTIGFDNLTVDDGHTIELGSAEGLATDMVIEGTVTLDPVVQGLQTFVGSVTLDGSNDQIVAASGGGILDNHDTISGAGAIGHNGDGALTLNNQAGGTIEAIGGTLTVDTGATFTNTGTIETGSGGTLVIDDAVIGTGSGTIGSGGIMDFAASVASGQTITFAAATGTLALGQSTLFKGEIAGISGSGDVLDLGGLTNKGNIIATQAGDAFETSAVFNSVSNTTLLTVTDETHSASTSITLVGDFAGTSWSLSSDGSGGVDVVDSPAAPAATIATGTSLDLSAPSSESVTFAGGTGSLVLDDPVSFSGQISGFTGTAPNPAHSDTIDLAGINFNSSNFSESFNSSTGVLSVTDGTNSASLTFDNFHSTLDFASDGNGGTLITDPPADAAAPGASPSGGAGGDQFVFKASLGSTGSNIAGDAGPGHNHIDLDSHVASFISSDPAASGSWFNSHVTPAGGNDPLIEHNLDGVHPDWLKNVALAGQHASDFHTS